MVFDAYHVYAPPLMDNPYAEALSPDDASLPAVKTMLALVCPVAVAEEMVSGLGEGAVASIL